MLVSFNERYLEKALVDKWVDENEADLLLTPNELQEFINTDSSNMMEHDFVNKRNMDLSVI